MYCSRCGKEIPDDSVFCPECGSQLISTAFPPEMGKKGGMVFCRGCGKEIHETAFTCPHCGAPQSNPQAIPPRGGGPTQLSVNWYLEVLKKYSTFDGRAQRKEYWYFVLFSTIISISLVTIDVVIGSFDEEIGIGLLSGLYSLAVMFPYTAVTIRRLHDTNRSGWWILLAVIPLIGAIVLIAFLVSDSNPESNQYGPPPKLGS
jgi:uncharacterized membrane protein YhaH (DUF805 family)/predicted RNA-binding Zn-ribbon protein involved in translation (DUF1610 family)